MMKERNAPCDWKCVTAKSHPNECDCRCRGVNHGYKNFNTTLDGEHFLKVYDEDFEKVFNIVGCLSCGEKRHGEILAYEHADGVYYPLMRMKLWFFWRCHNCGYDTSLVKALRFFDSKMTHP